jgi:prophage regulatory protein
VKTKQLACEPQLQIIRERECRTLTSLSRAQRWRLMRSKQFPQMVPLGERARGWVKDEIECWIRDRMAERDVAA